MDPLSKLPIECLQHILQVIADWDRNSTATLFALLTTNKHIFAATLPYLYNNPLETKPGWGYGLGLDHIHRQQFIRLLLGRIPVNILPLIVSLEFGFNTTTVYPGSHPIVNPIMDHITYIRHLNVEMSDTNPRPIVYEEFPGQYRHMAESLPYPSTSTPTPLPHSLPSSSIPPPYALTRLYPHLFTPPPLPPTPLTSTGFSSVYTPPPLPPSQYTVCTVPTPPQSSSHSMALHTWPITEGEYESLRSRTVGEDPLARHYSAYDEVFGSDANSQFRKTILYYEVCWSIASPILEQLESLTIPLVDVWRYLDSVRRLGQLECVRFNLDKTFSRNFNNRIVRERADGAIQAMVLFVKEHRRLFKDRLKIVHVNDVGMWGCSSYQCPLEIQLEIAKLVPPLSRPRS